MDTVSVSLKGYVTSTVTVSNLNVKLPAAAFARFASNGFGKVGMIVKNETGCENR